MRILNLTFLVSSIILFQPEVLLADHQGGRPELSSEVKAAFDACFTELGLTKGERPSQESREQLKSCLDSKGVSMPEPPQKGERRGRPSQADMQQMNSCLEAAGVSLPQMVPGLRTELDDATKAVISQCRSQMANTQSQEETSVVADEDTVTSAR